MRRLTEGKLIVATHNDGKLHEISALLEPFSIAVTSAGAMDLPVPIETETTFVGNARIKAHAAAAATGMVALADDSGLSVDALDGAPGVYTADWAETPQGRDFAMAMGKVHDALLASGAPAPWAAQFRCTLVLAWPDGHDEVFEGVMPGQIVWPMRGENGHGYDPIFVPDGQSLTFAEMDAAEKNRISHRSLAFRKLIEGCFT